MRKYVVFRGERYVRVDENFGLKNGALAYLGNRCSQMIKALEKKIDKTLVPAKRKEFDGIIHEINILASTAEKNLTNLAVKASRF